VIPSIIRSTDAGVTISQLNTGITISVNLNLSVDPATGDVYFISQGQLSVFRPALGYMPETLASNVAAIAFDANAPGVIYESLSDGSIVQSQDGGATWNLWAQLSTPALLLAVSADGVLNASVPASTVDAYAIRYGASGTITYGTYLSGGATTQKSSALTALDHLWIAGVTAANFPLLDPVQPSFGGATDGFIAEFDSDGTLLSSTYLGGAGNDEVDSIIPLPDGSLVAIGLTQSPDFAATLVPSAIGAGSTFIVHLRP
jgi:hypothetical protein